MGANFLIISGINTEKIEKKHTKERALKSEVATDLTLDFPIDDEFTSNENYCKLHLGDYFNGPIEKLLSLVKEAKIDIEDIFVSEVTAQYILYIEEIKKIDMEQASEFLEMAAWLLEIKSKSLLPKPKEEDDEDDPKKLFFQKIEEYKLYKAACLKMKLQEAINIHFREPDSTVGDPRFVLKDMTKDGLMKALQKMFIKLESKPFTNKERNITMDRFTVSDKIGHIKDILMFREVLTFDDLFTEDYTKSEIITTFQALLELLTRQFVSCEQKEVFGEIIITRKPVEE